MNAATSRARDAESDPRLEAARHRLRESASQTDALEVLREIVTGLLGCEEIGLFTVQQGKSTLFWSFGIDPSLHKTLDAFDDSAVARVMQGDFHIVPAACDQPDRNPPLRVFVPIRLHDRTVAVLVMLKLLPQKVTFDQSDIRLINFLSNEAARSLFPAGTEIHVSASRRNG
jgi:hypothetical protein